MSHVDGDDRIRELIEAAADLMPDAPVRSRRVTSLARRKALLGASTALAIGVALAALLLVGGNVSSYGLHGKAPISIPFVGVSVPDVLGMSDARALAELEQAGLKGVAADACAAGRSCVVVGLHPGAGSNVVSGAEVKLQLAARPSKKKAKAGSGGAGMKHEGKHAYQPKHKPKPTHPVSAGAKPRRIALSLSRSEIEADGKSTVTVQARVLDAHEKPVAGQRVEFLSSDPGERIEVGTNAGAVHLATITSSRTVGRVTIRARDGSIGEAIAFKQTPVEISSTVCESSTSTRTQGGRLQTQTTCTSSRTTTTTTTPTKTTTTTTTTTATTPAAPIG